MYTYRFTSTINDLLDAEEADTTERTMRRSLRWVVAAIGVAGIVAAIDALRSSPYAWEFVVGLVACGYIVYYFAIASYVRRRSIRRNNPLSTDIALQFREDGIEIELVGQGTYTRGWQELLKFAHARKGTLLYFDDGTVNWIPDRVFRDGEEREAFLVYLRDCCDWADVE